MSLSRMNEIPAINMPTISNITNRLVDWDLLHQLTRARHSGRVSAWIIKTAIVIYNETVLRNDTVADSYEFCSETQGIKTGNGFPQDLLEAIWYFSDPDNCISFMIELRWPDGITCPRYVCEAASFIKTRCLWYARTARRILRLNLAHRCRLAGWPAVTRESAYFRH